nr:lysosomal-trafficking regulator isoform X3 [Vanessa tameamea]
MSTEEESNALKIYWERFFKAETGTYEKSTWLELFLAEFIIRLNEGQNVKKLINFCPVSGVVSLVGCELLCGVHRVTSSINTHYSLPYLESAALPPVATDVANSIESVDTKNEEVSSKLVSAFSRMNTQSSTEILRNYLLGGVAWRCLVLLRALGVEGLSCCRQLSSVLIWLFGETSASAARGRPPAPRAPRPPHAHAAIHLLFSDRIWSKQKPSSVVSSNLSAASSEKSSISARPRINGQSKSVGEYKVKKRLPKKSDQTSESGDSNDDLQILNKSMTIKVCSPSDDFEYFSSKLLRSSNEYPNQSLYSDPFFSPRKAKPKADDYMTDKHREIINSEISTFEFTIIITDLLQELCKAESSLSGSEGSQISMQCINFSLKNLCSLQFGSLPANAAAYEPLEMSRVKVALTELLIVSLDQVLIHSDLCAKLINNGILPMLLRILEDVICKSSAKYNTKVERENHANLSEKANETESENLLKFIFGVAYSIMAFFHCLLMQCRTVEKLREFTEQFKLYSECLKGGLLKECIELMIRIPDVDKGEAVTLIKKLIESIGKSISAMKRVRSEVIHSAACPRGRHKACRARVAAGMHHHHDILGEAGAGLPLPAACCVSVLYGTLASLVPDREVAAHKPLRNKILRVMLACGVCCCFSPSFLMESIVRLMLTHDSVATLCLQLLEHTVYGDLGASILVPRVTDQLPCSICEQSDDNRDLGRKYCPHGVSPIERRSVWSFLIHYNSLLQLDNHNNVLHATVAHLLKVTPKCRAEMKYELLFSVVYPTFIVAKHRYTMRLEDSAYFLTVSCLNIFTSLLNTVPFAEQFIQKGGLSYVLELVALPEFSNQCCAILEIAIIVEIFKLIKENAELTYFREMSSLASVQMLFKSLTEMTDRCYMIYEQNPSGDEEGAGGAGGAGGAAGAERRAEALRGASTFWRACARLCAASASFRAYAATQVAVSGGGALLRLLLRALCAGLADPAESKLLIKIMEALLTVQFAVSEATGGRSKEESCAVVREALSARADAGVSGMRALCDALVGVALAAPAARRAQSTASLRVPPLFCASGSSSPDCSSSEESAGAPYASEHSEPRACADDGYEADVEVSKLEVSINMKTQKLSESLSLLSNVSNIQTQDIITVDCPENNRGGEMVHPELCVIVIDILSQLIDKLMQSGSRTRAQCEEVSRVCSGLARAWRLAPPRAPRPLRRLLAPHAPPARLLARADPAYTDLQRSVLELVQAVASHSIEAGELAALLRLLAAERPPLSLLLSTLRSLLSRARIHTPDHILSFPIDLEPEDRMPEEPLSSSFGHQAELAARRLRQAHLRAGVWSPWSAGAARCALGAAGWAPWLQGFALALWLRLHARRDDEPPDPNDALGDPRKEPQKQTEFIHAFSIGHDSLMFELWINTASGELSVRLTRPDSLGNKLVSAARARTSLAAGSRWHCLALNVAERVHKRRIQIQVTIYVDGRECETLSLPLQGILVRKATPSLAVLGQAGGRAGALHVGGARVFRTPALSAAGALHLAAHGPDLPCQIPCESAHFPSIITPDLLELNIDWDSVYEISSQTLRELHENLLLTFYPHAPDTMNLYHQAPSVPTVFGGRVSGGGGGGGGGGGEAPEPLRVRWASAPRVSAHRGVAPALLALGGPDLLLYLFARAVELDGSAEEQAGALAVLLRACGADARLCAQLHAGGALDLLLPVLAAPACRVTHHMLKVILDEACSTPILLPSGSAGSAVTLLVSNDSILVEPRLILLLMRAWRHFDSDEEVVWEESPDADAAGGRQRGSAWLLALAALGALLRPAHPHAAFNHYQACRVDLLRHLLHACKERFLNSSRPALGGAASARLVSLLRALLGSPPPLPHLALLADFLLLMHQASDTFVTHSRANFYFLLTPDTPETSDFNFLNFINKRRRSTRATDNRGLYDTMERSSSSSVSNEDVGNENHLNDLTEIAQNRDTESDKTDPESTTSADSTKQMKGLINTQIKESRQRQSSTLENSEAVSEMSSEQIDDDTVKEKINTVPSPTESGAADQLYASGIYQQRRVRTGAEPGWRACEGLLLLLRDALRSLPAGAAGLAPETLVVLANHGDAGVRAALVRAAAAAALPPRCLPLLANQISLYPCSWELATACAVLLTGCDVPLEDQLDEQTWATLDEEATARAAPLLVLLPRCARADAPLAHNIAALLRRLVDKSTLKALNEVAVVEVVVRSIRAVGQAEGDFEGRDLLLEDLYDLLCRIAVKILTGSRGTQQAIADMHHMLRFVECEGEARAGVQRAARDAQVALFCAQLDYLERRLQELLQRQQPRYTGYFSTVLSSVEGGLGARAGRSEAAETAARLATVLTRAATFFTTRPPNAPLQPDADFFDRLLSTLLNAVTGTGSGASGAESGATLSTLFWWAASPAPAARPLQPRLLRALYAAPAHALHLLAGNYRDPPTLRKLSVYLLTLIQHVHLEAEAGGPSVELAITDWARDWAVGSQAELAERVRGEALPAEAERLLLDDQLRWARHAGAPRLRAAIGKSVFGKEALARTVTEAAMSATRRVVEAQNAERKAFLEQLRRAHALAAAAAARWQTIIDAHTHERGVWHDPRGYPAAWQLDSTEGPGRVRVRLRRAHLRIPSRCFQPLHKYKSESASYPSPLHSVLAGGADARGALAAQLALCETVAYMARVVRVSVDSEICGELLLTDRCIHFVPEEECGGAASWSLGGVLRVATRRWCLQERALELFLCCGRALLLAFADTSERAAFLQHLQRAHLPNRTEQESLTDAMNQWRVGAITNWEYLMILNGLAGRSYNDLMQYPILPFIIADYTSKILDLTDPTSFRDLSKPMAVQNKNREQHYINTYNDLKAARRDGCSPLLSRQPHHYASLYSNSGGVLHYLVRLPPFTELFLNYQDNNFDMPDRTFHSLATTWRLITNDSPTDVKELIPELFYLPELFYNNEGLELGVRQCGARVDNVELPQWAADARLFTLVHRQALEAPYVSERLPLWIDLVFGYKQTGQAAVDAINVFPACTYYGFDPSSLEDEVDRTAAAAMVRTYGQAPRQLLRAPHPHRATDLAPRPTDRPTVWAGAAGARWGRYCGSPERALPTPAARRVCAGGARLQVLAAPRAVAVCARATALLVLRDEWSCSGNEGNGSGGGVGTESLCVVTWGHSDGVVRLRRRRDSPPVPLLHLPALDQVTAACGWSGGGGWGASGALGLSSGRVLALRAGARVTAHALHAHSAPIVDVVLCPRASLLVTASVDGVIVLWDLNELTYIRTLPNRDMLPVRCVAVSETLSDVATVHDPAISNTAATEVGSPGDADEYERDASVKYKSLLRVHTVNAKFVGSARVSEAVTCVCYSNAPEGVSVNCVVAGLASGGLRLYSSWDLRPVAYVPPPGKPQPVLSVTYSSDSQLLFACYAEGAVVSWESSESGSRAAPVRIVPAMALL